MERGSDRLALITGRIQSLPSSSSSSVPQSHHEDTPNPSSPPPNSDVQEDPHPHLSEQIAELPSEVEEKESDSTLPRSHFDANTEALRDIDSQVQQLRSSLTVQNAPPSSSSLSSSATQRRPLFTASGVSSAIAESERTRLSFSVAVAILVVLAHLGFPLLGTSNIVKTLLGFRPLYLVLLTNVTLVLARILGKHRVSEGPDRGGEIRTPTEGFEWADNLGKALELGLVAQKVLDALFMDCAVYAIIVVCGLSSA